ncbi:MAG: helix-turn-helix domain-containing protein [Candidatus Woesearchaeota archaeon]|jgi:sugar-specific transcriptional regulator TrmB|nr:helix-turn-helix domain-containing protein [Candidatus Woesearchaeota archaeon]
MMVDRPLLGKLKEFGLNTYEAKLWIALLSRGVSTAGELSDIANVPRSRSYDVLESLEKKGFILMKLEKPIKYIAVAPEDVLDRVKKKIEQDSVSQMSLIEDLKSQGIINELNLLHSQGVDLIEPTDLSGSLRSKENIYSHLENKIKTSKSVSILTTEKSLIDKVILIKSVFSKIKSKPKIRVMAPITKDNIEAAKELSKFAEVRHTDKKARFSVIDGQEIIFMLMDNEKVHPSYDIAIWANSSFFAKTLDTVFDSEWKKLKPVEQIKV